jgi:hypothetical protein
MVLTPAFLCPLFFKTLVFTVDFAISSTTCISSRQNMIWTPRCGNKGFSDGHTSASLALKTLVLKFRTYMASLPPKRAKYHIHIILLLHFNLREQTKLMNREDIGLNTAYG